MREAASIPDRHLGVRLRRFRRLRALKQEHVAGMLGVSQGLVSRWESAQHVPSPDLDRQIRALIAVPPDASSDRALRRLVESANAPVHLICDATHRPLAASPSREREWSASAFTFVGNSLWRYATDEIVMAEDRLADNGWFDRADPARISIQTLGNDNNKMRILPSTLEWEQIGLAEGRVGRLVTTVKFT